MVTIDAQDMRRRYTRDHLREEDATGNPLRFFSEWFDDACANPEQKEPNAMVLGTVGLSGHPRSRAVLFKGLRGDGRFLFYTNYQSDKGVEIANNPHVSLTFLWLTLERQVRVEGIAARLSAEDSDAYFEQRPRDSQVGAWASDQSRAIADRETLEARFLATDRRFQGQAVERPPHWGGFAVEPHYIEFWQGGPGRMHDRLCYTRAEDDSWSMLRKMP